MKGFLSRASEIALRFWAVLGGVVFVILTIVLAPLWYPIHLLDRWLRKRRGVNSEGKESLLDTLRRKRKLTILLGVSIIAIVTVVVGLSVGASGGDKVVGPVIDHIYSLYPNVQMCAGYCQPPKYRPLWSSDPSYTPQTAEEYRADCMEDCLQAPSYYGQAMRRSPDIWHVQVFRGVPYTGRELGIWWINEDTGEIGPYSDSAKGFEGCMKSCLEEHEHWWFYCRWYHR